MRCPFCRYADTRVVDSRDEPAAQKMEEALAAQSGENEVKRLPCASADPPCGAHADQPLPDSLAPPGSAAGSAPRCPATSRIS